MTATRAKPGPRSQSLSKEALVAAAVQLMEAAGDSGFSLRKLGEQVGCDPMAVLYHFKSKEGLQRAMADWLNARLLPANTALPWAGRLAGLAGQYRRLALQYPHTFRLMQRFLNTGTADYVHIEMVYQALQEAGLPEAEMPAACVGWYAAVYGLILGEIGGLIRRATAPEVAELEQWPLPELPLLRRLMPRFTELDTTAVFDLMIDTLHTGLAQRGQLAGQG